MNGEPVRLAPRWARYYPSDYEPAKQGFLRAHCLPGSTAFDLGAHIGLYTVLMASYVGAEGRVLAFEPTPATRRELRRTVRLNGLNNVDVREEAISGSSGHSLLNDTGDPVSNANTLAPIDRMRSQLRIRTTALDDLAVSGRVSCVKIDIEGAEAAALRGATALLQRDRPALTIEMHPIQLALLGEQPVGIWDLLHVHDYVMLEGSRPLSRDEVDARRDECYETQALPVTAAGR